MPLSKGFKRGLGYFLGGAKGVPGAIPTAISTFEQQRQRKAQEEKGFMDFVSNLAGNENVDVDYSQIQGLPPQYRQALSATKPREKSPKQQLERIQLSYAQNMQKSTDQITKYKEKQKTAESLEDRERLGDLIKLEQAKLKVAQGGFSRVMGHSQKASKAESLSEAKARSFSGMTRGQQTRSLGGERTQRTTETPDQKAARETEKFERDRENKYFFTLLTNPEIDISDKDKKFLARKVREIREDIPEEEIKKALKSGNWKSKILEWITSAFQGGRTQPTETNTLGITR